MSGLDFYPGPFYFKPLPNKEGISFICFLINFDIERISRTQSAGLSTNVDVVVILHGYAQMHRSFPNGGRRRRMG
jgi:hypothetical protein